MVLVFFFIPAPPPAFACLFPAPPSSVFLLSLVFARAYNSFLPGLFCTTGLGIAEVPVLRLRQAFWLADVVCLYVKHLPYFKFFRRRSSML